jgi:hypothetical protein
MMRIIQTMPTISIWVLIPLRKVLRAQTSDSEDASAIPGSINLPATVMVVDRP